MREETIKRVLNVDVDGLKGIVKYTIKEMYNVIKRLDNGFEYAETKHRLIDEFTLTWNEIEEEERTEGKSMKEQIYETYGIEN